MNTPSLEGDAAIVARLWNRYHKLVYAALFLAGAYLGGSGWGWFTSAERIAALEAFRDQVFPDSVRAMNARVGRQDVTVTAIAERVQFLLDERCADILEGTVTADARLRRRCRELASEVQR